MTRGVLLFCLLAAGAAGADLAWDPVPRTELGAKADRLEPDAPAEAIFRRLRIDDSDYPSTRRVIEYDRYRIFDPEKAANLTRLDVRNPKGWVIAARLTLPDGTSHIFGKEALKQRTAARTASEQTWLSRLFGDTAELRESFLAVPGIEAGAVLEFQVVRTEERPGNLLSLPLQIADVPIRRLELNFKSPSARDLSVRQFTLNGNAVHAQSKVDSDHRLVTVAASDVPSLRTEPFAGPPGNYEFMFVVAYRAQQETVWTHHGTGDTYRFDPRKTPWAALATELYLFEQDRTQMSRGLRTIAAQIVGGATSEEGKARAIHRFVQDQFQTFLKTPRKPVYITLDTTASSAEDVLNWAKHPGYFFDFHEFVWLEVALDRAAGLQAQTVVFPNRGFSAFSVSLVADAFLPWTAVRVQVDGQWRYSMSATANRFAFGELPWEAEGQVALLANPGKQDFVPVPLEAAERSQIVHEGTFVLAPDGTLTGTGRFVLTGHPAAIARNHLRNRTSASQKSYFHNRLGAELKGADITMDSVENADDPEKPLIASFSLEWPEFAVRTRTRLIFKPGIFHSGQQSPFASSERHYNFNFPYHWKEIDKVVISAPAGYAVETKRAPSSIPGETLDYRCSIAQEAKTGKIHYSRTFTSQVIQAPASAAPALRRWYDAVAARDQFELVFAKQDAPAKTDTGEAP